MSKLQFIEEGRLNKDEMNRINGGASDKEIKIITYCTPTSTNENGHNVVKNCSCNYHYCDVALRVTTGNGDEIMSCSGSKPDDVKQYRDCN